MHNFPEVNLKNPLFSEALNLLDKEIIKIAEKIYDDEFKYGEVTLKLTLGIVEDFKEYPAKDDLGFKENTVVHFNRPVVEHNISTVFKKQYKEKGSVSMDSEIKRTKDGQLVLMPVLEPQLDLLNDEFLK